MGAHVTLVGPPPLIPRGIEAMGPAVDRYRRRSGHAAVVYVLRMQRERTRGRHYVPTLRESCARWGVTPERVRPGQKVMHQPGQQHQERPSITN